jgi:hypothetical protein
MIHPSRASDLCAANMPWSLARTFLWFMCCKHAVIIPYSFIFMIYVLQTCCDHSILIHSCDLCAANMPWLLVWMFYHFNVMFILVIYVLRTCRNYLFEHFIRFHTRSCNLCLWTCRDYLFECLSLWYKNVIKTHFAMKTLKRVNIVMWAL